MGNEKGWVKEQISGGRFRGYINICVHTYPHLPAQLGSNTPPDPPLLTQRYGGGALH